MICIEARGSPSNLPHVEHPTIQVEPLFDSLQKFKNLNRLQMADCGSISSDWLSLIPSNVTHLNLCLSTSPTANQLSMLPACIRYMNLCIGDKVDLGCDWTDEILQSLPRSLHGFWINAGDFPNLTQRMYEYLPPILSYSPLRYMIGDFYTDFIPPLDRLYKSM